MIDWKQVADLRDEVGEDAFEEVVSLFLEEVDGVIARLVIAPAAATLADDLHFIRGSAVNLGFEAFCDVCRAAERQLRRTGADSVALAPLIDAYRNSKQSFLDGLADSRHAA
ncbi:HPt (histidine-containing phosphotransfer) domain-containing protein [Rhodovulum iodosum]|uniref:HPt (Histidine-containing phosphotransfer) domain-containing protein n=1 Tax=Rhodovulum iodosum TaxID=68291 RepID=A0ABV3XSC8_9RHOB|nr:Hpt domain-containing protein [Rhodovulum robiginosum]RSK30338.1 Hpt domain-containing protein [Rhodovulum robiginosum]